MQSKIYKSLGIILISCALLGYIFIADELRHSGEFLGVSCILFAGFILLAKNTNFNPFKKLAIEWLSLGLLISIPFGGFILDNMPLGIGICIIIALILAIILRKKV